eukprot:1147884-Pelagomonas_calceolata.AAC.7
MLSSTKEQRHVGSGEPTEQQCCRSGMQQALWTQARERANVITIICANSSYAILKGDELLTVVCCGCVAWQDCRLPVVHCALGGFSARKVLPHLLNYCKVKGSWSQSNAFASFVNKAKDPEGAVLSIANAFFLCLLTSAAYQYELSPVTRPCMMTVLREEKMLMLWRTATSGFSWRF